MNEQLVQDNKLGADLMQKRKRVAKVKNIEEAGPDSPALAQYSRLMNMAAELGAKPGLTLDEQKQIIEAKNEALKVKEDYEVPDDSIQVDVFYPVENEAGDRELKKTHFYTQAEAPLHLEEGSEYATKYQ
jgi:hypothetical protein